MATHSSKLEAAVPKSSVLDGEVAELHAGLGALSAQHAMRVDEPKILANEYYDKLKPDCLNSGITHADRAAAPEQEIQSLEERVQQRNVEQAADVPVPQVPAH